ncbi:hypothetical protein AN963_21940 [Brevibacillus choshinensis]|uniref:Uncharacterized protein n=1 Tax=Brevibacillus choshinensis TaxID=54911 RepID=A0ABR5N0S1_BRECH|nr:hypothetical protein [Brevibacillus choshinensis]KQL44094.1 hypothetical protein AN963_21940 [Brevibacillus choshinensis]
MNHTRYFRIVAIFLLTVIVLQACSSNGFDAENKKEYGINGVYVGQNIKEAIDILGPTKADFMDMVSRQSYTVDQMSAGAGEAVMGMLLLDRTQLILKVKAGKLQSIMLGGVAQEDAQKFKTMRGLSMYDSAEQLKKLYGEGTGDKEITYQGSHSKASFGIVDNKVAWMRFDSM